LIAPNNIDQIEKALATVTVTGNTVMVADILANHAFRFEQEDGSMALPVKLGGKYHMLGKVCVCTKEQVHSTIARCKNILTKFSGTKVFVPPIPRYIFTACCEENEHCIGTGVQKHTNTLLESTLGMHKHIKESLVKLGTKNFVVPDMVQQMVGEKTDIVNMADGLKNISSDDRVHLSLSGYRKTAEILTETIRVNARPAAVIVSGGDAAARTGFYWRGFLSPVGSVREQHNYKLVRQDGGKWRGGRGATSQNKPYQLFSRGGPSGAGKGRGYPPGGRFRK